MLQRPSIVFAALLLGGLSLVLSGAQAVFDGTFLHNFGNAAALKEIIGDSAAPADVAGASNYLTGVMAYYHGDYASAVEHLQSAETTYEPFVLHWKALSLEQNGDAQAALQALAEPSLHGDPELSLYGDILLRTWETAQTGEKQRYLDLVRHRRPDWLLPYANRLIDAHYYADAIAWAQAAPDNRTSPAALLALGRAALYQGNNLGAEAWLRQAYTLHQTRETAYWYGLSLIFGSDPAQGVSVMRQAIAATVKDNPELPWMYKMLAAGAARSGDCIEAAAAFDQAASIDPSNANLEHIAQMRAQYQESCQH